MKIINPIKIQEKIGFTPHKLQQDIIDCYCAGKRRIVVSAGIRSGKSMACAFIVLMELLSEGKEILVISPSYPLTLRVLENVHLWLKKLFKSEIQFQSKPFPRIEMNWSGGTSYVEGKSGESPEQILGKSYDLIVIDEASRLDRKIFENYLITRVGEKKGKIVAISTPLRKDWFFEEFQKAKETNSAFQFSTIDNPYYPKEEYESVKKQLPKAIFDREFGGIFTDEIASIFPNARDCVSPDLPRAKKEGGYHLIGLDLAKEEDWTAICVADKNTQEIIEVQRWQKLPYTAQFQKILGIVKRFEPCRVIIDSLNVGAMMGDSLRAEGIWCEDFVSSGTISPDWKKAGSKQKLVEKVMGLFESRSVKIPNHPDLLDELSTYSYVISDAGNIKYGVPSGLHDDLVDSLFLACWNLQIRSGFGGKTRLEQEIQKGQQLMKMRNRKSFI